VSKKRRKILTIHLKRMMKQKDIENVENKKKKN
jgi:hypothetical protein